MLESATLTAPAGRPVLKTAVNDRMAGTVPVWERGSFAGDGSDGFGFGDLLDIVNPLQHIPLVSMLYRGVTGDQIGPVARVAGGALYGGPVGGAASLANVIVEEQTGRDIAGNVLAVAAGSPPARAPVLVADNPEARLTRAVRLAQAQEILPESALAFAGAEPAAGGEAPAPERYAVADGRTAGSTARAYRKTAALAAPAAPLPAPVKKQVWHLND